MKKSSRHCSLSIANKLACELRLIRLSIGPMEDCSRTAKVSVPSIVFAHVVDRPLVTRKDRVVFRVNDRVDFERLVGVNTMLMR